MNMKIYGRLNVEKHRNINNSDKYITVYILLKFRSLENIIITSSEPKDYFGRSGTRLITSLGIKTNVKPKKEKSQVIPLLMSV